ncbi:hypothetical protein Pelo_11284 [Pelomyxa schiedti]|nr:hypothetical protein Pelo_11284 [Pelomyxa schiedti]
MLLPEDPIDAPGAAAGGGPRELEVGGGVIMGHRLHLATDEGDEGEQRLSEDEQRTRNGDPITAGILCPADTLKEPAGHNDVLPNQLRHPHNPFLFVGHQIEDSQRALFSNLYRVDFAFQKPSCEIMSAVTSETVSALRSMFGDDASDAFLTNVAEAFAGDLEQSVEYILTNPPPPLSTAPSTHNHAAPPRANEPPTPPPTLLQVADKLPSVVARADNLVPAASPVEGSRSNLTGAANSNVDTNAGADLKFASLFDDPESVPGLQPQTKPSSGSDQDITKAKTASASPPVLAGTTAKPIHENITPSPVPAISISSEPTHENITPTPVPGISSSSSTSSTSSSSAPQNLGTQLGLPESLLTQLSQIFPVPPSSSSSAFNDPPSLNFTITLPPTRTTPPRVPVVNSNATPSSTAMASTASPSQSAMPALNASSEDILQSLFDLFSNVDKDFVVDVYLENAGDFNKTANQILSFLSSTDSRVSIQTPIHDIPKPTLGGDVFVVNSSADSVADMWLKGATVGIHNSELVSGMQNFSDEELARRLASEEMTIDEKNSERILQDEAYARALSDQLMEESDRQTAQRLQAEAYDQCPMPDMTPGSDFYIIKEMTDIDVPGRVVNDCKQNNIEMDNFKSILSKTLLERFIECTGPKTAVVMCYHGTDSANTLSITKIGLVVPGEGEGKNIRKAHGAALGVGIYLSKTPAMALRYCRGNGPNLFVCLTLIGNKFVTTDKGEVLVINNAHQVLPVGVIQFTRGNQRL